MKEKILHFITETFIYKWIVFLLKKVKLKKGGISLYTIVKIFIEKVTKDELLERAEAVTFNFTLAIFPAIIFLFTLTPFIHEWIPGVSNEKILEFLGGMMPESMYSVVSSTVHDIISIPRGGLLTFGVLFSLILATNGMVSLMKAFNACYKTRESRGFFKTRLVAMLLTVMLAVVLILAIVLIVVSNIMVNYANEMSSINVADYNVELLLVLRFIAIFVTFFLAISFIYYYGPTLHDKWSFFSVGALVATLLCMLVSYLFSTYITNFGTYNKLYGSIGALIGLMVWQLILSIVLLVGYEINASIHKAQADIGLKK